MIRRRKMSSLRATILAVLALNILVPALPTSKPYAASVMDRRYELAIHNHSGVVIYSIYMSHSYESGWGTDRLGNGTLNPQHYITLSDIVPGEYDFLFIDEYERKCMLRDIPIFKDGEWDLTDEWLNNKSNCKR
jgi:hypothetical protein